MSEDLIIVVLGSTLSDGRHRYAIFPSLEEDRISDEDVSYLNERLQDATIITGSLDRALILADVEADIHSSEDHLPGILLHHLSTCRISADASIIEIN